MSFEPPPRANRIKMMETKPIRTVVHISWKKSRGALERCGLKASSIRGGNTRKAMEKISRERSAENMCTYIFGFTEKGRRGVGGVIQPCKDKLLPQCLVGDAGGQDFFRQVLRLPPDMPSKIGCEPQGPITFVCACEVKYNSSLTVIG